MRILKVASIGALMFVCFSCSKKSEYDASGTFEAVETIVPAEANGVIKEFHIEEGQEIKEGQYIGYIDTIQLYLKMKQLKSQVKSTISQKPDIAKQIASLKEQIRSAEREQKRMENLVKANAGTQKQLDDLTSQVDVLNKQLEALESSLSITTRGISLQADPIAVQIDQVRDQLDKSKIVNPTGGVVLGKYAEPNEMAVVGKPLYKIADLSTIILRAYITGDQLPKVKLNQQVKVLVDADKDAYKEYSGRVEWVNSKAEFTPKTIQTKDERANLVYAIKIRVKNDGFLKIGMYGEVKF